MIRDRMKGIEVFVCVAETGTFTAAADRLSLTSSAVGKAVLRLESRLGVRLFHRTRRSVILTDEGIAFNQTCIRLLSELVDAENVLANRRLMPSGTVRVDMPVCFGRRHVMPILRDLLVRNGELCIRASFTDRFIDLAEEGVDVAVRIGDKGGDTASLASFSLGAERLIFCASPDYLKRCGPVITLEDLAQCEAVLWSGSDGRIGRWLLQRDASQIGDGMPGMARMARMPPARLTVGSIESLVDAVVAGSGVAQLATWLVRRHLDDRSLVQILPDVVGVGLPVTILWQRNKQLLPRVNAVVDALSKLLAID